MISTIPPTSLRTGILAASIAVGCVAEGPLEEDRSVTSAVDAHDEQDAEAEPVRVIPTDEGTEEVVGAAIGEFVEVEDGIWLPVPEPGRVVSIEVLHDDGGSAVASLQHDLEGRVAIAHPDDHLLGFPPGTSAACLSKCDDASFTNFFNSGPSKWKSKLEWYYRHAQSPLPYDDAVNAFKSAAAAVPSSRNSCGMDDRVDAKQVFRGETNIVPGVGVQNGVVFCTIDGLSDGTNVIGWGYLPGNTLAVTCASATLEPDRNRITAMDMRFDKAVSWFKGNGVPANCSNAFSLRGVATHEFGHAFGLGHTNQCNLVMAPNIDACSNDSRKFGRGDIFGLRELY